jgi:hypothetical protein
MKLLNHIIDNIFLFLPIDVKYSIIDKRFYEKYKKLSEYALMIQKSYRLNEIPYNCIIDKEIKTPQNKLIRYYIKYYPLDGLTILIELYFKKLNQPKLIINKKEKYTLRDLKEILKKCSVREICYVGW